MRPRESGKHPNQVILSLSYLVRRSTPPFFPLLDTRVAFFFLPSFYFKRWSGRGKFGLQEIWSCRFIFSPPPFHPADLFSGLTRTTFFLRIDAGGWLIRQRSFALLEGPRLDTEKCLFFFPATALRRTFFSLSLRFPILFRSLFSPITPVATKVCVSISLYRSAFRCVSLLFSFSCALRDRTFPLFGTGSVVDPLSIPVQFF